MFFFLREPAWEKYRKELGIQRAVDYLRGKGLPDRWPEQVPDPKEAGTLFEPEGKPHYRSECPHYEGYYLCGGCGGVNCCAAKEILPGIVWYTLCKINTKNVRFIRRKIEGNFARPIKVDDADHFGGIGNTGNNLFDYCLDKSKKGV